MHFSVQVEPPPQLMLLLAPAVILQVEPPLQSTLHDSPQEPAQSLLFAQSREQLPPAHEESPISHVLSAGHTHEVPAHSGSAVLLHAAAASKHTI